MLVLHKGLLGLPLEIFICRENILHHCANSRVVMLKFYPVLDGYVLFSVNIRKYVRILLKTGQKKKKKREKSSDALNTFLVALAFQSKVNADLSRVQCATTLNESKKKKKKYHLQLQEQEVLIRPYTAPISTPLSQYATEDAA